MEKICLVTCNTDFPLLSFGVPVLNGLKVFPVMKLPCNLHLLGHPFRQYSDREISAENSEDRENKINFRCCPSAAYIFGNVNIRSQFS